MMVACVAWVAWRLKQGENMEFSREKLTDGNRKKKQGFEMALELACAAVPLGLSQNDVTSRRVM